jgi:hypothetical protein
MCRLCNPLKTSSKVLTKAIMNISNFVKLNRCMKVRELLAAVMESVNHPPASAKVLKIKVVVDVELKAETSICRIANYNKRVRME